jgi:hypothetical protein
MSIRPHGVFTVLAVLCLLACGEVPSGTAAEAGTGADAPATTRPAAATQPAMTGELADYYGFDELEMFVFNWSLGDPVACDLDGDGLMDLAVIDNDRARIELLLQKADFSPSEATATRPLDADSINDVEPVEATWRFRREGLDLEVAARSLAAADLDGDGRMDLAWGAEDELRLARQLPAEDGAPAEASPLRWAPVEVFELEGLVGGSQSLAAGDLDGDGRQDLAVLAENGIYLLMHDRDAEDRPGAFRPPQLCPSGGEKLRGVKIVDLDGDGRQDLLILTGEGEWPLRVRFQHSGGSLGPEERFELPSPVVLEAYSPGPGGPALLLGVSRSSGRVDVFGLSADRRPQRYPVRSWPLPRTTEIERRDLACGDLDGDGRQDLVASNPVRAEYLVMLADAQSGLSSPRAFPGLVEMRKLACGDLDGDGRDEVVCLSGKEKIIGISRYRDGRLGFPESVALEGEPLEMALADLDGDGRGDLAYIVRDEQAGAHVLRTILALGREDAAPGPHLELTGLRDRPEGLLCGDVDGDGRPDAMILAPYGPLVLVRRDGQGGFVEETRENIHAGLVENLRPGSISMAPLGPGGGSALLAAQGRFARALRFDGETGWEILEQFQPPREHGSLVAATAWRPAGEDTAVLAAYDASHKRLVLMRPGEDGTYEADARIDVGGVTVRRIFRGDFGGNGGESLVLAGADRVVELPLGAGSRRFEKLARFDPDTDAREKIGVFNSLSIGDINADGTPELLLGSSAGGYVTVLAFDEAGTLAEAMRLRVFQTHPQARQSEWAAEKRQATEPRHIGVADLTGDGLEDLLLVVHDRLVLYPQSAGTGGRAE